MAKHSSTMGVVTLGSVGHKRPLAWGMHMVHGIGLAAIASKLHARLSCWMGGQTTKCKFVGIAETKAAMAS